MQKSIISKFSIFIFTIIAFVSHAQVGIAPTPSIPDNSSMLDIKSSAKGLLIPRMSIADRNLISNPANALLLYQNDSNPGFYYNTGSPASPQWKALVSSTTPTFNGVYKIPIDTLPFTINVPGSYIVTKRLSSATTGITINTSDVNIDLNFSALKGLPGNTSSGINVNGAYSSITIYNGNISNWSADGITAGTASNCRVFNITSHNNGSDGIFIGNNSYVSNCIAHNNTFDGIDGGISNVISDCIAFQNGDSGIEVEGNSTLTKNSAYSNATSGIRTTNNCVLSFNTCSLNLNHGFFTGNGNILNDNASSDNTFSGFFLGNGSYAEHNVARQNARHGFECNQDVTAIHNFADSNIKNGFDSSFNGGKLDDNNSTDNENGYVISGTGWLITRNSASGNTIAAFNIIAGSVFATVITSATINTNTNPYANTSF